MSKPKGDWTYHVQPAEPVKPHFQNPNEYNPTPPKVNIPHVQPVSNQHPPVPNFHYPQQYNPTPPTIVHIVPGVNQYKPVSYRLNRLRILRARRRRPLSRYLPRLRLRLRVSRRQRRLFRQRRPVSRNPLRRRARTRASRRQRRIFRYIRYRRTRPCRPSYWRIYYGYYGKYMFTWDCFAIRTNFLRIGTD